MPETLLGDAGPLGNLALPVTYSWDFGDSQTVSDTSNVATHSYTINNLYLITLTVTDANGCSDQTQKTIDVFTTPASFTVDTSGSCYEENGIKKEFIHVNLLSDSNNLVTNWHWDTSPVKDAPIWLLPDFHVDYNVPPGSYPISLTVTNSYGCTSTLVKPGAVLVQGPTGSFSFSPKNGCRPLTVDFHGSSNNSQIYAWDFGDGTVFNDTPDSMVQHTYTTVNTYTPQFYVGFQVSGSTCYIPVPKADSIIVTSIVDVNIIQDSLKISEGDLGELNVIVTNGSPPYTYNWTPSSEVTPGTGNGVFLATTTGVDQYYYLEVPYGLQSCSGIDSVYIKHIPCDQVSKIPNVFTPDGNFQNDTYHIDSLCNSTAVGAPEKNYFHVRGTRHLDP